MENQATTPLLSDAEALNAVQQISVALRPLLRLEPLVQYILQDRAVHTARQRALEALEARISTVADESEAQIAAHHARTQDAIAARERDVAEALRTLDEQLQHACEARQQHHAETMQELRDTELQMRQAVLTLQTQYARQRAEAERQLTALQASLVAARDDAQREHAAYSAETARLLQERDAALQALEQAYHERLHALEQKIGVDEARLSSIRGALAALSADMQRLLPPSE